MTAKPATLVADSDRGRKEGIVASGLQLYSVRARWTLAPLSSKFSSQQS
jgi:hypothetical protein